MNGPLLPNCLKWLVAKLKTKNVPRDDICHSHNVDAGGYALDQIYRPLSFDAIKTVKYDD